MSAIISQPGDESNNYPFSNRAVRRSVRITLALWLATVIREGGVFTVAQAEAWVQEVTGLKRVEIDRRIRELREVRWVISNYLSEPGLAQDTHRLVHVGDHIWHHNYQWPQKNRLSDKDRRIVLDRDNNRCARCGHAAGEPYPDQPERIARLTIGRILPGSKGGKYTLSNCRAECDRCNQGSQDKYYDDGLPPAA
jgi:hypothetical protein